jgi:hypothetical protein
MSNVPETETYQVVGEEVTYGVAPAAITTPLGRLQNTNFRIINNTAGYKGLGCGLNDKQIAVAGLLDVGINQTFHVINGYFLKLLLGSISGAGTVGSPYAYAENDTIPSITIEDAYKLDTNQVLRFLGLRPKRATIKCIMNRPVEVTIDWDGKQDTKTATYQTITQLSGDVFNFTDGSYEQPSATAITEVQEATIVIEFKTQRYGGIGSRTGNVKVHGRKYTGSFKKLLSDGVHIENAMGGASAVSTGKPAEIATLRLNFSVGTKYLRITLNNINVDYASNTALDKSTEESITFKALTASAIEVL